MTPGDEGNDYGCQGGLEMATAFPRVGGDYVFAREAYGPVAGLVVGWLSFLIGYAAPTAVVSRLAANYATKPFQ